MMKNEEKKRRRKTCETQKRSSFVLHTMRSLDDCFGRGRKANCIMRSQFDLVKSAAPKTLDRVDCGWVLFFLGVLGANALPLT